MPAVTCFQEQFIVHHLEIDMKFCIDSRNNIISFECNFRPDASEDSEFGHFFNELSRRQLALLLRVGTSDNNFAIGEYHISDFWVGVAGDEPSESILIVA